MRRLAVPCAILLCLAGCGGDDDEEPARSVTVNPNSTLEVTGDEYSFDGDLAHNLRIERDGEDIGGTPTFPGGVTQSGRVNLEHGNYEMVCTVGDHAELGMTGELEVR
jgi:plastocyanin